MNKEELTVTPQGEELDSRAEETTPENGHVAPPVISDAQILTPPQSEIDVHAGEHWDFGAQRWIPNEVGL